MTITPADVLGQLTDIIHEVSGNPRSAVGLDHSLRDDLDIDSLGKSEMVAAVEQRFGVDISAEDERHLTSVGGFVDYLTSRCS
ncbi:acyl carrier protein [Streptomyces goshikiensis]|uniref:acyl carrier protein n=1 Tax=Streptomyces goshikiensis TaxID=1942 RepID=UPI0036B9D4E1